MYVKISWTLLSSMLLIGILGAQFHLRPAAGTQTFVEFHLRPSVNTGPMDPNWSPDSKWIAFSMKGDIWKVPAGGGEAVALTQGPGYFFEPAWSPNGRQLAAAVETEGNLEIAVVDVAGGSLSRLTSHPEIDIEPAWSPDGKSLYFVSRRRGNLDIYHLDLDSGELSAVVAGPGNEFQPAVSRDGKFLAYIAPVEGFVGAGGIWVKPLPSGEPKLVLYEETSYRTRPAWTPDGAALLYVSDATGSNNIAIVPTSGGNPVDLTHDSMDEFSPAVSPDGSTIAFVSNSTGPTRLFTMSLADATDRKWKSMPITSPRSRVPMGRLRGRVLGPDGNPVPARLSLVASDGRSYSEEGGFHRLNWVTGLHYFHTEGSFEVELPAGRVTVEAKKGSEYYPSQAAVEVAPNKITQVELRLKRLIDAPSVGWYSGDTHVHDLHGGGFGLSHRDFFLQLQAEDVHVTNALIHMDGTKLMGRWNDLTGSPHPLSNSDYILYYSEEFRSSFGHIGLLGLKEFVMPLIGGTDHTPYAADVLKVRYFDEVRRQGGIGGFLHPYRSASDPSAAGAADIPLHAALGKGDFYDVVCAESQELPTAEVYYRLLNCGLRLAATGGTDNFSNCGRDAAPGASRTYAYVDGPLSFGSWIEAVKAGRTFATSGPLLFLEVEGKRPGTEISLREHDPSQVRVGVKIASIMPLDRVEILLNGTAVYSSHLGQKSGIFDIDRTVHVQGSGWIAARAIGPAHRYVSDSLAYAQTSPVYIVRNGVAFQSAEDARFLLKAVESLWERVAVRNRWRSADEKKAYSRAVEQARSYYLKIIQQQPVITSEK